MRAELSEWASLGADVATVVSLVALIAGALTWRHNRRTEKARQAASVLAWVDEHHGRGDDGGSVFVANVLNMSGGLIANLNARVIVVDDRTGEWVEVFDLDCLPALPPDPAPGHHLSEEFSEEDAEMQMMGLFDPFDEDSDELLPFRVVMDVGFTDSNRRHWRLFDGRLVEWSVRPGHNPLFRAAGPKRGSFRRSFPGVSREPLRRLDDQPRHLCAPPRTHPA